MYEPDDLAGPGAGWIDWLHVCDGDGEGEQAEHHHGGPPPAQHQPRSGHSTLAAAALTFVQANANTHNNQMANSMNSVQNHRNQNY